jgi:hypothetical protein
VLTVDGSAIIDQTRQQIQVIHQTYNYNDAQSKSICIRSESTYIDLVQHNVQNSGRTITASKINLQADITDAY